MASIGKRCSYENEAKLTKRNDNIAICCSVVAVKVFVDFRVFFVDFRVIINSPQIYTDLHGLNTENSRIPEFPYSRILELLSHCLY
jgi:hypothetical protein